ncbi:MAG: hypothetical protein JSS82_10295 [Bacteroidetes bacterium]|nr:hypothetical protein [Bacteroidota bacterium]
MGNTVALNPVIADKKVEQLPKCVQQWLAKSGALEKPAPRSVSLLQSGLMRTSPRGKWMKVSAQQYFDIERPAFLWNANVRMSPFIWFTGRDSYEHGKGHMLIKLFSLLPIVNARGYKIDQGSLLRYLGEMCWFPAAAKSKYIHWEALGPNQAKATMIYWGVQGEGVFNFDESGRITSFSAHRYMAKGKRSSLEHWHIPITEWKRFNGVLVPSKGEVTWKLRHEDFSYFKWEIIDMTYQY